MRSPSRRTLLAAAGVVLTASKAARAQAQAVADSDRFFVAEAFRMKDEALARGDQPYGAVMVIAGTVAGYEPSRVNSDRNPDAHAERVALWDAQKGLGRQILDGAVIYATSPPCAPWPSSCSASWPSDQRAGVPPIRG